MGDEELTEQPRPTAAGGRRPMLGRMSVFVIGVIVGAVLGAAAGVAALTLLGPGLGSSSALIAAAPPKPVKAKAQAAAKPERPMLRVSADRPLVIGVFGDSMADGLWTGLYRHFRGDDAYKVVRFSQHSTGLARYEYLDIQAHTAEQLAEQPVDVAVVLFGANDAQGMIVDGRVEDFDSPVWRRVYAERIDGLIGLFRQHGVAVYWVGLPRMKRAEYDRRAGVLNALYEARATAMGAPFVSTVPVTANAEGGYDDYLLPEGGTRPKLMRAKDGIHMTPAGYARLASPVLNLLRADVAMARAATPVPPGGPVTLVASSSGQP